MVENENNEPQESPDTQLSQNSNSSVHPVSGESEATPRTPAPIDWVNIPFGKHYGKSLPQVVLSDPDWLYWAYSKGVFQYPPKLIRQAKDVFRKASRIALPSDRHPDSEVEYTYQYGSGKLVDVTVVPKVQAPYGQVSRSPCFSLFAASERAEREKLGGKIIIRAFKRYVLGNEKAVLRRDFCEAFFSNPANFCL